MDTSHENNRRDRRALISARIRRAGIPVDPFQERRQEAKQFPRNIKVSCGSDKARMQRITAWRFSGPLRTASGARWRPDAPCASRDRKRLPGLVIIGAVAATALGTSACATSYYPNSPRVAVVRGEFRRGFVKNGVYYPGGLFGGCVADAVRGVPAAEQHADTYAALSTAGTLGIFGSEALGITASVVSATASPGEAKNGAELGLFIASGVALVTGIVLHVMSESHLYDAANIYNDEMDRRERRPDGERGTLSVTSDKPSTSPSRPSDE